MNENCPSVSIVIPNWNGKEDTLECLNALRKLQYKKSKLEIIISDNSSSDGSQNAIEKHFSIMKNEGWATLKLVENKMNLGPSTARNIGIKAANKNYSYIWLIDNDIIADPKALIELTKIAEKNENIKIVGSVNYFFDKPEEISFCGSVIDWRLLKFKPIHKKVLQNFNNLIVDEVAGSSLLIERKILQKIGIFDPHYFCYYNDTDLCIRAGKAGYKIAITLNSIIWHKVSNSTRYVSGFSNYFYTRNIILLIKKHVKLLKYIYFLFGFFLYYLPKRVLKSIVDRNIYGLKHIFNGLRDGLFSNPQSFFN